MQQTVTTQLSLRLSDCCLGGLADQLAQESASNLIIMNKISILTLKGQDINLLASRGQIGYSMNIKGKDYGAKFPLLSRKTQDVATAVLLLLINALETMEALNNENN